MPRTYKPKSKKHWSDQAMQDALAERETAGTSVRDLSKKYNIPKTTLGTRLKKDVKVQGRKPVCYSTIVIVFSIEVYDDTNRRKVI